MKQGFMSIDGKFFTSEAKCKEHEATVGFVMYDEDGATTNPDSALVVTVFTNEGLDEFRNICNQNDSTSYGVNDIGDWVWSLENDMYKRVDIGILNALVRMYVNKYEDIA